ncbi:LLM class flavin-dependent oxidoreductase [Micromonospora marina]|uniref:LLM class flavin-dependent oxidoreductase n=1 Tax=Micromonospora marina TaxID=307120 RepID=UPI003D75B341
MRVGIMVLPELRWSAAIERWQAVETLGFDSAWTYDHLWWRALRDGPWFGTFPLLAAAACATTRIRLGTLVTSPNFRHPVPTAKDAITIDDVSGGRFTLGVGAGSTGAGDANVIDTKVLGPGERVERFAEFVGLLDRLLRQPVTTHHGRYFTADEARTIPGCVQQPRLPIAVAATGPRGMAIAARHGDAWVTCGPADVSRSYRPEEFLAEVRRQADAFSRECERIGRSAAAVDRILVTTDMTGDLLAAPEVFVEYAERYAAIGVTDLVVHWPRESGVYAGERRALEAVAEKALPHVHCL